MSGAPRGPGAVGWAGDAAGLRSRGHVLGPPVQAPSTCRRAGVQSFSKGVPDRAGSQPGACELVCGGARGAYARQCTDGARDARTLRGSGVCGDTAGAPAPGYTAGARPHQVHRRGTSTQDHRWARGPLPVRGDRWPHPPPSAPPPTARWRPLPPPAQLTGPPRVSVERDPHGPRRLHSPRLGPKPTPHSQRMRKRRRLRRPGNGRSVGGAGAPPANRESFRGSGRPIRARGGTIAPVNGQGAGRGGGLASAIGGAGPASGSLGCSTPGSFHKGQQIRWIGLSVSRLIHAFFKEDEWGLLTHGEEPGLGVGGELEPHTGCLRLLKNKRKKKILRINQL